ncbi:hypothetical protein D3C72_2388510 [compost metagenome]
MGGVGRLRRRARRSQTSTNTVRPSMKCRSFIRLRSTLSLGNRPRSSIRAYTAANSTSINQCKVIDRPP